MSTTSFFSVDPAALCAQLQQQQQRQQQQQQQQQLFYQPSYIISTVPPPSSAACPSGYFLAAAVPSGNSSGPYWSPQVVHSSHVSGNKPKPAAPAVSTTSVPCFLNLSALSAPSAVPSLVLPSNGYLGVSSAPPNVGAVQMLTLLPSHQHQHPSYATVMMTGGGLPTPAKASALHPSSTPVGTPYPSNHPSASLTGSPFTANKEGKKRVADGKASPPKATAAAAAVPEAKTFEEDPVEIDTSKRQLIVNYLPQKLSTEDFKAIFRPFGELDEENSHIVFDFRTAGGVNTELLAWYCKRNSRNATVSTEDGQAPAAVDEEHDTVFAELIKSIDFSKVEKSMRSKGYGFIYYKDGASTEAAIKQLNGFELNGRKIKVRYAEQQRNGTPAAPPTKPTEDPMSSGVATGVLSHPFGPKTSNTNCPVTPVSNLAATPPGLFLESAEALHLTANMAPKAALMPIGYQGGRDSSSHMQVSSSTADEDEGEGEDTTRSKESIISSVYELLEVDSD